MTKTYSDIINDFTLHLKNWEKKYSDLVNFKSALQAKTTYEVENILVGNEDLYKIINSKTIKYILVGDNPGKNEQFEKNKRYLIGTAGTIARNFFARNNLVENFNQEVIVLNKTPIHTSKTKDLKQLKEYFELDNLLIESQIYMAKMIIDIQKITNCKIWLTGLSELKSGLFKPFREYIVKESKNNQNLHNNLACYMHFSMGSFSRDFNKNMKENLSLKENLNNIGKLNRNKILNF